MAQGSLSILQKIYKGIKLNPKKKVTKVKNNSNQLLPMGTLKKSTSKLDALIKEDVLFIAIL